MKANSEKISVIIPVFNAEKYIGECIKKLCCQTYGNLDIILVNDGSTDKSLSIITELQKEDYRIKCINLENNGVSHARNAGLVFADGEYIAFLDADDYFEEKMLEKLHTAITVHNADIAVCQYTTNEIAPNFNSTEVVSISKKEMLQEMMLPERNMAAFVWNRLYRSSIIKKHNIQFDERVKICEDTLFNFSLLPFCRKIVVVNEPLYFYRINSSGAMFHPKFNENKLTANIAYEFMLTHVAEELERSYIEIACMLYNEIMLFQICRYGYKVSRQDMQIIKKMLRLNTKKFLQSSVGWKYKLVYLLFVI